MRTVLERALPSMALAGATLVLAPVSAQAKTYKGAELYSNEAFHYGRMEMRMRMARGSGILSTFFTYKNGSEVNGTFWEEIDIEVFGKENASSFQSNIITGTGNRTTSEQVHEQAFSFADDYHTFALEWTPDHVAWEIDGTVVRETTGGQAADLQSAETLRFNIWAANIAEWVGDFDDSALPQYQYVNWISYSAYENGAFVHKWTDDFDSLDTGRWSLANWTFDENLADFVPQNIIVRDGTLILALTRDGQTGFSGTVPQDDGLLHGASGGSGPGDGTGGSGSGGASNQNGAGGASVQGAGGATGPSSGGSGDGSTASGGRVDTTASGGQQVGAGGTGSGTPEGSGGGPSGSDDSSSPGRGESSCAYRSSPARSGGFSLSVLLFAIGSALFRPRLWRTRPARKPRSSAFH